MSLISNIKEFTQNTRQGIEKALASYDTPENRHTVQKVALAATIITGTYVCYSYFSKSKDQNKPIQNQNGESVGPSTSTTQNSDHQGMLNRGTSNPSPQPLDSSPAPKNPTDPDPAQLSQITTDRVESKSPHIQEQANSQTNSPQHHKDSEGVAYAAASLIIQGNHTAQEEMEKNSLEGTHEITYVDVTGSANSTVQQNSNQDTTDLKAQTEHKPSAQHEADEAPGQGEINNEHPQSHKQAHNESTDKRGTPPTSPRFYHQEQT